MIKFALAAVMRSRYADFSCVPAFLIVVRCCLNEIYSITAEDNYFTAEEAIDFGLATGIFKGKKERQYE